MRAVKAGAIFALGLLAGCSPFGVGEETTTSRPVRVTTIAPTTSLPLVAGCPEQGEFVEDEAIALDENLDTDSTTIGHISWTVTEACETFTIEFVTAEGAPATTPPSVDARYIDGAGVIRVGLDVGRTIVTDQLVETNLVERLYVVRALDGGMFIDFHLSEPTQARLTTAWSPARVSLSLQPGIVDFRSRPAHHDLVVLLTPTDRSIGSSPIPVEGYARVYEANVLVVATAGNEVVAQGFTTAADSVDTWGEFSTAIELEPGPVSLFVGNESAEDGSLQGLIINLTVR